MLRLTRFVAHNSIARVNVAKFASMIKMPSLSPTMSEGGIVEWHKNEGDTVSAGDLICDIQTDKAVVGMEAEEDGVLAKIIKPKDSQNVKIGEIIAVLADPGEDWKNIAIPTGPSDKPKNTAAPEAGPGLMDRVLAVVNKSEAKLGPAVRRLLDTYGLKSDTINPSGPHQILTKSDVLQHIDRSKLNPLPITSSAPKSSQPPSKSKKSSKPPESAKFTDIPLSEGRRALANQMAASKSSIPHFYSTSEASVEKLLRRRALLESSNGMKLTLLDFVVKACGLALRLVPCVNDGMIGNDIVCHRNIDISLALPFDTPRVVTATVFGVDKLSISEVGSVTRSLTDRANHNELHPHELQPGTFSICDLGPMGVKEFAAVILPPQAAILGIGAPIIHAAFNDTNPDRPQSDTRVRLTLSADARIVDEVSASQFVKYIKSYLENPDLILDGDSSNNSFDAWSL